VKRAITGLGAGLRGDISLAERFNNHLSDDNAYLKVMLEQKREEYWVLYNKYEKLRERLDELSGLAHKVDEIDVRDFKPIGGYESRTQRAQRLSMESYRAHQEGMAKEANS